MVKKSVLLRRLKACIVSEDNSLPLLQRFLKELKTHKGLVPDEQVRCREMIRSLLDRSEKNVCVYQRLIKSIEGSPQDAF